MDDLNDLLHRANVAIRMGYWALAASKLRVAAIRCQNMANNLQKERLIQRSILPDIYFEELDNDTND
jgi:hypothetical protein